MEMACLRPHKATQSPQPVHSPAATTSATVWCSLERAGVELLVALVTYHKITDPIDWINLLLIQCRILSSSI